MKIGYFVKKEGEDLKSKLTAFGCDKVFYDKDDTFKKRAKINSIEDFIRTGDTLVIPSLLNFGLTAKELIKFINNLLHNNIQFHCIDDTELNFTNNQQFKDFIHKLYEIDILVIKNRKLKGNLESIAKDGDNRGRKKDSYDIEQYNATVAMYKAGKTYKEIMEATGIKSTSTIKRHIERANLPKRNSSK